MPITGTWNNTTGGAWTLASNWIANIVPNGIGDTANFQLEAGTSSFINLGGLTQTVGILNLKDSTTQGYTLFGGTLRMQAAASAAINLTANFNGLGPILPNVIANNAVLQLASNTTVTTAVGTELRILGQIVGTKVLTKNGTGTLKLNYFNNIWSGGTAISNGAVETNQSSGFGSGSITFSGDSVLRGAAGIMIANQINISTGVSATLASQTTGDVLAITGAIFSLGASGTVLHFGTASDTGTVKFTPSAITVLPTGTIAIDGGTLQGVGGSLDLLLLQNSGVHIAAGATLDLHGGFANVSHLTGAGSITNMGLANSLSLLALHETGTATFSGAISDGSGFLEVEKINGGDLTLSGANSYSGGTNVLAGKLKAGITNAFGTAYLQLSAGASLDLAGFSQTSTFLTGAGNITNNAAGFANLTLNSQANNVQTFGGTLSNGAGPLSLLVNIKGTQTLTALNTYSGTTNLAHGSLALKGNGSIAFSSKLTVNSNSSFDMIGITDTQTFVNDLSMNGGTVYTGGKSLFAMQASVDAGNGSIVGAAGADNLTYTLSAAATGFSLDGLAFFNWTEGTDSVVVNGNALANNITGSARGDLINGEGGNDTVDGGLGVDTAYYASSLANATITYHADHSVTITTPGEGSDTLLNMEFAHFSDATISLVPVPQPVNDSYSAVFNTSLIVSGPGVLANDIDPAGLALTAVLDVGPTHGTLSLQSSGGFTYTPNAGFLGTDTFFYDAFNTASNSAGGAVSITVGALPPPPPPPPPPPVNHAPVASNDSYTTAQDAALNVAGPGVLSNDTDPDGNSISVASTSSASHGTIALQPGGNFVYTPAAGYVGTDSFTYSITDGSLASNTATVNLNVTAAGNHAPVAGNDSYSTVQDVVLAIAGADLLANDSDPDGSNVFVSAAGNPAHGTLALQPSGSFVYTPATGYVGADSFTYAISDGSLTSNTATVSINVTAAPTSHFTVTDTSTGVTSNVPGDVYTGPVAGLAFQYIYSGPDNINVTGLVQNSFIHTGAGFDAIDVSIVGGTNVLDGGTNSNFLVGGKAGSGSDTFFIDDRSPPGDIWSTVVNFHAGDAATIFGITPNGFATSWVDGEGAAGFTGLTLHVTAPGVPIASITLAGYTTADLGNGRLSQIFGTEGDGTPYLYIHGDA